MATLPTAIAALLKNPEASQVLHETMLALLAEDVSDDPLVVLPDLAIRVNQTTLEYIGYQEYRPGSMVIASCELLNRRVGDVVPALADVFEQALWVAKRTGQPQQVQYEIKGHRSTADVIVQKDVGTLRIRRL